MNFDYEDYDKKFFYSNFNTEKVLLKNEPLVVEFSEIILKIELEFEEGQIKIKNQNDFDKYNAQVELYGNQGSFYQNKYPLNIFISLNK